MHITENSILYVLIFLLIIVVSVFVSPLIGLSVLILSVATFCFNRPNSITEVEHVDIDHVEHVEVEEEYDSSDDESPGTLEMRTLLGKRNNAPPPTDSRLLDFRDDYKEMGCTADNRIANQNKYRQFQEKISMNNKTKPQFDFMQEMLGPRENTWWEDESWHAQ